MNTHGCTFSFGVRGRGRFQFFTVFRLGLFGFHLVSTLTEGGRFFSPGLVIGYELRRLLVRESEEGVRKGRRPIREDGCVRGVCGCG